MPGGMPISTPGHAVRVGWQVEDCRALDAS